MSEPESQAPLSSDPEGYAPTVARRMAFYHRAGGIVTPLLTAVIAFLMGGHRRPLDRPQPLAHVQGDLRRIRAQLALPCRQLLDPRPVYGYARVVLVGHEHESHRRVQPDADAADDDAADPHRARGRICVPLRPLQHRRPGPVPHGHDRRRLHRFAVHRHGPAAARPLRARRRCARRRALGCDRRLPESDGRRARGDHDDHAELDRVLGRELSIRPRWPAAEPLQQGGPDLGRHRRQREAADALG